MEKFHITKSMLRQYLDEAKTKNAGVSFPLDILFNSDRKAMTALGFTLNAEQTELVVTPAQLPAVLSGIDASTLRDRHTEKETAYLQSVLNTPDDEEDEDEDEDEDELEEGEEPEPAAETVTPINLPDPTKVPVVAAPGKTPVYQPATQTPAQGTVALSAAEQEWQRRYEEQQQMTLQLVRTHRQGEARRELSAAISRGVKADVINFARSFLGVLADRLETQSILKLSAADGTQTELDTHAAVVYLLSQIPGEVPNSRVADTGKTPSQPEDKGLGIPPPVDLNDAEALNAAVSRIINQK